MDSHYHGGDNPATGGGCGGDFVRDEQIFKRLISEEEDRHELERDKNDDIRAYFHLLRNEIRRVVRIMVRRRMEVV